MRWPFSLRAEVAGCIDQPPAEMLLPNAVDEDPRCQRSGIADNRLGELPPAAPLLEGAAGVFRQHRDEPPRHHWAGIGRIAADLHANVLRLRLIFKLGV